jgi:hypothetical protein
MRKKCGVQAWVSGQLGSALRAARLRRVEVDAREVQPGAAEGEAADLAASGSS